MAKMITELLIEYFVHLSQRGMLWAKNFKTNLSTESSHPDNPFFRNMRRRPKCSRNGSLRNPYLGRFRDGDLEELNSKIRRLEKVILKRLRCFEQLKGQAWGNFFIMVGVDFHVLNYTLDEKRVVLALLGQLFCRFAPGVKDCVYGGSEIGPFLSMLWPTPGLGIARTC
jgi:hypothetical protein